MENQDIKDSDTKDRENRTAASAVGLRAESRVPKCTFTKGPKTQILITFNYYGKSRSANIKKVPFVFFWR